MKKNFVFLLLSSALSVSGEAASFEDPLSASSASISVAVSAHSLEVAAPALAAPALAAPAPAAPIPAAPASAALINLESYLAMFEQISQPDHWGVEWMIASRQSDLSSIFESLVLEVPTHEMRAIFEQHRTLVHRRPRHDTLVIGCGNLPAHNPRLCVNFIDDYGTYELF